MINFPGGSLNSNNSGPIGVGPNDPVSVIRENAQQAAEQKKRELEIKKNSTMVRSTELINILKQGALSEITGNEFINDLTNLLNTDNGGGATAGMNDKIQRLIDNKSEGEKARIATDKMFQMANSGGLKTPTFLEAAVQAKQNLLG